VQVVDPGPGSGIDSAGGQDTLVVKQGSSRREESMSDVKIEKPTPERLKELEVDSWSPWECEPSSFDWTYDEQETFYVLEGKVKVDTPDGEVHFGEGDLVTFPRGMSCRWHVIETIRKRFTFE
jgi:hypothetical protein